MEKLDLKKKWKQLYQPKAGVITTVTVPPLTYLMVDGEGDPNNSKTFGEAVEALYSLSYTLKFSLKKSPRPVDYWRDAAGGAVVGGRSARFSECEQVGVEVDGDDSATGFHCAVPRGRGV